MARGGVILPDSRVTRPRRSAFAVTAGYAAVSTLWIVLSDPVVAALPEGIEHRLQTVKGLLFVLLTSLAIYTLVVRLLERVGQQVRQTESVERLLGQVVDTVPVGVLHLSDEGLITFMNPAASELLGIPASDATGRRFEEVGVVAGDSAEGSAPLLAHGAASVLRVRSDNDGLWRAFTARTAAVDEHNRLAGYVVALADTTDAQQARDRAARLLRGYRYLSQAAVAMTKSRSSRTLLDDVAHLAVDEGGFTAAWVLHQSMNGSKPAESAFFGNDGHDCAEAAHVAQAYGPSSEILARLVSGEIMISNDLARDPRNPWYACAGAEHWGSMASMALEAPGDRAIVLALFSREPGYFDSEQMEWLSSVRSSLAFAVHRLALDQQRLDAEEALQRSEQAYRTMFEVHPQPMWVYDLETLRILAVNDAAVAKYGYSRDEFQSMTIADLRPRDEVPRLLTNVLQVTEGLDDAGIWTHTDKSGRTFPVHIYSHVLDWEGRHAELVMVMEVARVE